MDDGVREQYEADAAALHADFGEPCRYRKASDPENPIETTAIVTRDPPATSRADGQRTTRRPMEAELRRSDVDAIADGDEIELPEREGGTPRWWKVAQLLEHDEAQWLIAVGR